MISVVVVTYNRSALLAQTLQAVARQTRLPDEVIVVNNGSTDNTPDIIAGYEKTLPLRCVRLDGRPIGGARNAGIAAARGDIIALTDDDCIPCADWLAHMVAPFENNERVGAVGGLMMSYRGAQYSLVDAWCDNVHFARYNDLITMTEEERGGSVCFFMTANAAFRRVALQDIGGFDDTLRVSEDVDVSVRLTKKGWELVAAKDALIHHVNRPDVARLIKQFFEYRVGDGLFYAKHWEGGNALIVEMNVAWLKKKGLQHLFAKEYRLPFFAKGIVFVKGFYVRIPVLLYGGVDCAIFGPTHAPFVACMIAYAILFFIAGIGRYRQIEGEMRLRCLLLDSVINSVSLVGSFIGGLKNKMFIYKG